MPSSISYLPAVDDKSFRRIFRLVRSFLSPGEVINEGFRKVTISESLTDASGNAIRWHVRDENMGGRIVAVSDDTAMRMATRHVNQCGFESFRDVTSRDRSGLNGQLDFSADASAKWHLLDILGQHEWIERAFDGPADNRVDLLRAPPSDVSDQVEDLFVKNRMGICLLPNLRSDLVGLRLIDRSDTGYWNGEISRYGQTCGERLSDAQVFDICEAYVHFIAVRQFIDAKKYADICLGQMAWQSTSLADREHWLAVALTAVHRDSLQHHPRAAMPGVRA